MNLEIVQTRRKLAAMRHEGSHEVLQFLASNLETLIRTRAEILAVLNDRARLLSQCRADDH